MTSKSIEAFVIHKQWTGDSSARVHFFTREFGLLSCVYKGGRTPKKQALVQAFIPLWLCVSQRYERFYVQTLESIAPMFHLEGPALFSALYINELLYYLLKPAYPVEDLYEAYEATLNKLAFVQGKIELESILRRFEWAVLKASGHSFSWTKEAKTDQNISAQIKYVFVAGEGFVKSERGILGSDILAISEDNLNQAEYLRVAKTVMRQAIDYLLSGKEIKARALFVSS